MNWSATQTPADELAQNVNDLYPKARMTAAFALSVMNKTRASAEEVGAAVARQRESDLDAERINWHQIEQALRTKKSYAEQKQDEVAWIRSAWCDHEFCGAMKSEIQQLPLPHHDEILAHERNEKANASDIRNWHETECRFATTLRHYDDTRIPRENRKAAVIFQCRWIETRLRGLRVFGDATRNRWNQMAEKVISLLDKCGETAGIQLQDYLDVDAVAVKQLPGAVAEDGALPF